MLLVEPRALIRKLSALTSRSLEDAASACLTSRHYEVTAEHLLLVLLDRIDSDLHCVLREVEVPVDALRIETQHYLGNLRAGNGGKPVFSPLLLEWMQDAWLYASTELGITTLRSAALLARIAQMPNRYLAAALPTLDAIPRDRLRKELLSLASNSAEAEAPGAPGQAPAGPRANADSALARFTTNLTARAEKHELDPVFGRELEIRQMVDILCRRRKNNPILVGDPGVGKTALVEGLAMRIAERSVPPMLLDTQVLVLDLGALQAGAGVKGEFEQRLNSVIQEVKGSAKPIVLFIDEAHTLIGAGGAAGQGDAANLLKPALARGELRTVAATTWAEFKKYFEKDAALERRFQPVKVDEPSEANAVLMLRGLAKRFEDAHGVLIRDDAVQAAVTLSSRYLTGRQLPDKAIDLLDTASARVKVMRAAPPGELEDARAALAGIDRALAALAKDAAAGVVVDDAPRVALEAEKVALREREKTLDARWKAQRERVERIDALRRDGGGDRLRVELDALQSIPVEDRMMSADVDDVIIATVISDWTGVPAGKMMRDDVAQVLDLENKLRERVRGQDRALGVIASELRAARSGLKAPTAPLGVFLLVGPSGVGKTETALALADALFGGERFLTSINMSEYQERHTVSRLIGSPPGYVGYGEGGQLTEAVRQRPYSAVLLDEVEKADRDVLNIFYQVFDKGILVDGEGRQIDFKNTVVLLTSNLATDIITGLAAPGMELPPAEEIAAAIKPTLSAHFKPALLARMTIVPYIPIRADALRGIVEMKLGAVVARAHEAHHVAVDVAPDVIDAIVDRCREVESGARNVEHILRAVVMPALSRTILEDLAQREEGVLRVRLQAGGAQGIECVKVEG